MTIKKKNTFTEALKALGNLIMALLDKHKWLYLFMIYIIWMLTEAFSNSETITIFILCLIVCIVSFGIYIKTKNYSETTLSFILGLFTIFSTNWNTKLFMLFISFYLLFNIVIFMIASIELASKKESIITQASLKYRGENFEDVYRELNNIANKSSKNGQLGPIERAEIIRFLSYRKTNIEHLEESINIVELIQTVQQCSLKEALILFHSLYVLDVVGRGELFSSDRIIRMLDEIVVLPVSPEEFHYLFNKLKSKIMRKELTFFNLMHLIKKYTYEGMDVEEIILEIN